MSPVHTYQKFCHHERIPVHFWEHTQKFWQQNPEDCPTFEEINIIHKDDKFALEEFRMKTG